LLRGVLQLPTGTLVAEETCRSLNEAIDKMSDALACQIRRHKSGVRKDYLVRRRRRRQELIATGPYLEQDALADRKDAFFELLLPQMDQVYDHARRELIILELEGMVPKGHLTARDLVDDVLLRACETFGERPANAALDVWLFDLLNQRLDEVSRQDKPMTLVASASPSPASEEDEDNADLDDIQYWMRHVLEQDEPVSLEELLPDDDLGDIWDEMSDEEQRTLLLQLIEKLPKHERQSLLLMEAHGFELSEIAGALDRSQDEVEACIQAAREKLRGRLSVTLG
jgi:RNA polymerase sigma factor (sigma-70 family)